MLLQSKPVTWAWATLCAALLIAVSLPQRATAADSDDPPSRVARLSFLRGSVSFQPAGESDWVPATINRPMTTGDKLWADADSLAELHIGSAVIRLNSNTGFSFLNLDDRTVQIQLSAGTLGIRVRQLQRDEVFEVDTPNQAFSVLRPGRYRLEASEDGDRTIVIVSDGKGEATGGDRSYTIESRERASLTGTDSLSADVDKIDRRDRDDFDDWCQERDSREEHARSVRYVSPEMVGYEDLDESGVWRHDREYGEVWVPTAVPVGWAPYHYGHWAWISPWGWTWVDDAPWGYAPFHYGRWAYAGASWCWIPGPIAERPVYAPALVAFVGGPNFAVGVAVGGGVAVGWFPLGPREVYVPAYRTSPDYVTRVNISNTNVSRTTVTNVYNTTIVNNTTVVNNVTYVNRGAPGAVTAVPANAFSSSQSVASSAVKVNPNQIANAPVTTRASVAPTQTSVLGHTDNKPGRPIPPGWANRPVVAKTTPPPPPVSFEQQRTALAAHPGQPLAHNEINNLRPVNVSHPLVRQGSPSQAETPNSNRGRGEGQVAGAPGTPNRRPPSGIRPNEGVNAPANTPAANMPPRNDRPDSAQPGNRPVVSEAPNARPNDRAIDRPNNGQPSQIRQNDRPEQPVNSSNPAPSSNRPANNQPSYRPPSPNDRPNFGRPQDERPAVTQPQRAPAPEPSNTRPANVQPSYRPQSGNDRPNPGRPENERPAVTQPQSAPAPEPSNNRPANVQPSYRPQPGNDRPNPGRPENERPAITQPQSAPSVQPNNQRMQQPSNEPASRPSAPAPVTRSAAPSPQPSGNVRPAQQTRPAPAPAPTRSNNSSNGKKDSEKKN